MKYHIIIIIITIMRDIGHGQEENFAPSSTLPLQCRASNILLQ